MMWTAAALTTALMVLLPAASALAQAPPQAVAPPSAEQLQLAHEVFEAAGGAANVVSSVRTAITAALAQAPKTGTPAEQQTREALVRFVEERAVAYTPEIIAAGERAYATVMTEAQLRDVLAFYRTPTGRALAEKLPQITATTIAGVQPVLRKMQRDVLAHLCSVSTCTPAQKAQLAALGEL